MIEWSGSVADTRTETELFADLAKAQRSLARRYARLGDKDRAFYWKTVADGTEQQLFALLAAIGQPHPALKD